MDDTFDYIVVGGGTSGCVLAGRLSEDPGQRVLLIEAGQAQPSPAMANPLDWPALAGTAVDWAYQTVPQPGAGGEPLPWPRGRVLSGSSGINGMMHIRGDRRAYNAWEQEGAVGWNYEALLPFFKRSEQATGDPAYRGTHGPMHVGSVAHRISPSAASRSCARSSRSALKLIAGTRLLPAMQP